MKFHTWTSRKPSDDVKKVLDSVKELFPKLSVTYFNVGLFRAASTADAVLVETLDEKTEQIVREYADLGAVVLVAESVDLEDLSSLFVAPLAAEAAGRKKRTKQKKG